MRTIDVTNNVTLIEQGFGLKTKKGELWRTKNGYRVDWVALLGMLIVTHFGTFTLVEQEKIEKDWYWTLKDNDKMFRIKRDKARKNKRLPKNIEIIDISDKPIEKDKKEYTDKYNYDYQLCLPPARDLVDFMMTEVNNYIENLGYKKIPLEDEDVIQNFYDKVTSIFDIAIDYFDYDDFHKLSKQLLKYYHSDIYMEKNNNFEKDEKFIIVQNILDVYEELFAKKDGKFYNLQKEYNIFIKKYNDDDYSIYEFNKYINETFNINKKLSFEASMTLEDKIWVRKEIYN